MTTADMDVINGVAGLNAVSRVTTGVDAADDVIFNVTGKGIVLKDTLGNYWRVGVTTLGVLALTSLGTTKP